MIYTVNTDLRRSRRHLIPAWSRAVHKLDDREHCRWLLIGSNEMKSNAVRWHRPFYIISYRSQSDIQIILIIYLNIPVICHRRLYVIAIATLRTRKPTCIHHYLLYIILRRLVFQAIKVPPDIAMCRKTSRRRMWMPSTRTA